MDPKHTNLLTIFNLSLVLSTSVFLKMLKTREMLKVLKVFCVTDKKCV